MGQGLGISTLGPSPGALMCSQGQEHLPWEGSGWSGKTGMEPGQLAPTGCEGPQLWNKKAAVEIVSNVQLLWGAGQMEDSALQQMPQLQGSVGILPRRVEGSGGRAQGLQGGSLQCPFQRKSFLHGEAGSRL